MGLFTTKVTAIIAAILIAAIGAWGGLQYVKLQKAQADKVQAEADRDHAAGERDKAIAVNATNQATIAQLQKEKEDIQASLNALEADRRKNQVVINNLSAAIRAQSADPANKVELSPVLKSTVDAIQKQREGREGAPK